jgi:SAM-dependent methyltransferase
MTEKKFDKLVSENAMTRNAAELQGNSDRYFQWNLGLFSLENNRNILDLGCGPGLYLNSIMKFHPLKYIATDYSPHYVNKVKSLVENIPGCEIYQLDLLQENQLQTLYSYTFNYILCFDVLEHINEDETAIRNIKTLLQNTGSGALCIKVPAIQTIYGANDKSIGHYRRYSLQSLKSKLLNSSYQIERIGYQNLIGILPWFIIGKVLKRSLSVSENEGKTFDRMVPMIKSIEKFIPPPIGLSLFCKCR